MRTAYWDTGDPEMYMDNPNLRWGSPSCLLEPGDPGYVPVPSPNPKPPTKVKRMKNTPHQRWLPTTIAEQILWLVNFRDHLGNWTAKLGLAPAQVTTVLADCNWLIYVLETWLGSVRTFGTTGTQAALLAQTGTGADTVTLPVFNPPAPASGITPQLPGSLTRIFAFVQSIKRNPLCDDEIMNDLKIVGTEEMAPDAMTLQPVIYVSIVNGQVFVKWGWGGQGKWLDACEIWVDRGDGKGYVFLTIDTTPGYTDTQAFPTALTNWTYKAIYRQGDKQVGKWSAPVTVAVGG
jgi:hypothetical protein